MRAPRPVADLLLDTVPELRDRLLERRLRQSWASLVGPDVARRSQPQTLTGGCLEIRVDNSPWLHELTLRSAELTARLQDRHRAIRSVRFVLGPLAEEAAASPRGEADRRPPLSAAELEEIEGAMSAIHDPTLATTARRLLVKAWRFSGLRGGVR